jgi:GT2 family glycosyltransferase
MQKNMNRMAVVVLNYNGAKMLLECLRSLAEQSYPDYQIVLIDNNSKDNSPAVIEAAQKEIGKKLHVIMNPVNSGFAGGVNIGFRYALDNGFGAVALFNNDAVAEPRWLEELVKVLHAKPDVGIVTGLFLNRDGKTIDSTGDWYSIWGMAFPRLRNEKTELAPESGYVFGATGGASLFRLDMIRQIGLFDERFFAYYEDVDVSFRAQLAGWKVYYTKKAVSYHAQGSTNNKIPGFTTYHTLKNVPMLYWKNVPFQLLLPVGWRLALMYPAIFINRTRKGAFWYALKGAAMALLYFPASLVARWDIQRKKKVETAYLRSIIYPDIPPSHKGLHRLLRRFRGNTSRI